MRTTVRIRDELLLAVLRERAQEAGEWLTDALNKVLERGLAAEEQDQRKRVKRFRQRTYSMGKPLIDLTTALSTSMEMDDIERMEKLERQRHDAS